MQPKSFLTRQLTALTHKRLIPDALTRRTVASKPGSLTSFNEACQRFERDYLAKALRIAEGDVSQAAKLAQYDSGDFYQMLQRHDLKAATFAASRL